jgi:hypothetical protein
LIVVGFGRLNDTSPGLWEGLVTLTVSEARDASRIEFDRRAKEHAQRLVSGSCHS